ncbi:putative set domain-containing protein [Phaeomoniella chlamydospora]|uniref:Putative set domain-containing protein n=1 Tax=Phaeomoniella chlamydospora TaxID=158046 RepID=A0A0G2GCS5_PHACM|nr:putative set domain-containing protein [Phaeomoniella chlamydospora]
MTSTAMTTIAAEEFVRNDLFSHKIQADDTFGISATKDILHGTVLVQEQVASFKEPKEHFHGPRGPYWGVLLENEETYSHNLNILRRSWHKATQGQHDHFNSLIQRRDLDPLVGTALRNAVYVDHPDQDMMQAIFGFEISKFDHSCVPNATLKHSYISETEVLASVVVRKNIKAGSPITISYTDTKKRFELRRRELARRFGFSCNCPFCVPHEGALEDSDEEDAQDSMFQCLELYPCLDPTKGDLGFKTPWKWFHLAVTVLNAFRFLDFLGPEFDQIFLWGASIAMHHSDVARAEAFFRQWRALRFPTEDLGAGTEESEREWLSLISLYGKTSLGTSSREEADYLLTNDRVTNFDWLFMYSNAKEEYLRISMLVEENAGQDPDFPKLLDGYTDTEISPSDS